MLAITVRALHACESITWLLIAQEQRARMYGVAETGSVAVACYGTSCTSESRMTELVSAHERGAGRATRGRSKAAAHLADRSRGP